MAKKKRRNWIEERDNIVSGASKLTNLTGSYQERVQAKNSLDNDYKNEIVHNTPTNTKANAFNSLIKSVNKLPNINQLQKTITSSYNSLSSTKLLAKNKADLEKALNNANKFKATYGSDKNIETTLDYLNNIKGILDSETKGGSAATNMIIDRQNALSKGDIGGAIEAEAKGNMLNEYNLDKKFGGMDYKSLKKAKTKTPAEEDFVENKKLTDFPLETYADNAKKLKELKNKRYESTGFGGTSDGEYERDEAFKEKAKEQNAFIMQTIGNEIGKKAKLTDNEVRRLTSGGSFGLGENEYNWNFTAEERPGHPGDATLSKSEMIKVLQKRGLDKKEASVLLDYYKNIDKEEQRKAAELAGQRTGRMNNDIANLAYDIAGTIGQPIIKGLEGITNVPSDYSYYSEQGRNKTKKEDMGAVGSTLYDMAETVGTIASAGLWGGAAFVPFAAKAADDSYNRAIEKGATKEEAEQYAGTSALTTGLIYGLGLKGIHKLANKAVGGTGITESLAKEITEGKASSSLGKAILKDVGKNGLKEGATFAGLNLSTQTTDILNQIATLGNKSDWEQMKQAYIQQGMSEDEAESTVLGEFAKNIGIETAKGFGSGFLFGAGASGIGYARDYINKGQTLPENVLLRADEYGTEVKDAEGNTVYDDNGQPVRIQQGMLMDQDGNVLNKYNGEELNVTLDPEGAIIYDKNGQPVTVNGQPVRASRQTLSTTETYNRLKAEYDAAKTGYDAIQDISDSMFEGFKEQGFATEKELSEFNEFKRKYQNDYRHILNKAKSILGEYAPIGAREQQELLESNKKLQEYREDLDNVEVSTPEQEATVNELKEEIDNQIVKVENALAEEPITEPTEVAEPTEPSEPIILPQTMEPTVEQTDITPVPEVKPVENKNITVDDELNDRQAEIVARGAMSDMSDKSLNLLLQNDIGEMSPTEYSNDFRMLYALGKDSSIASLEDAVKQVPEIREVINDMSPEIAGVAFSAGRNDIKINKVNEALKNKPSGKFTTDFEPRKDEMYVHQILSDKAKLSGLDVIVVDGINNYKGLENAPKTAQGVSFMDNGKIVLDRNVANILGVAAHEMDHFIEKFAPEEYKILEQAVSKIYRDDLGIKGYDKFINGIKDNYKASGVDIDYDEARKEGIAFGMETLFLNDKAMETFVDEIKMSTATEAQKKNILHVIFEWLKKAIEQIKQRIKDVKVRPGTEGMLSEDINTVDIARKYLKGLEAMKSKIESMDITEGAEGESKFSLSEKGKELSTEYNKAVKDDNMAAAEKLVEEYAKGAGYTQKVYHGTEQFGFTKIDLSKSDDNKTFWATDDIDTAQTYSGTKQYETKKIKDRAKPVSELSPEQKIELYKEVMDNPNLNIKYYPKENKEPLKKQVEGYKNVVESQLLHTRFDSNDQATKGLNTFDYAELEQRKVDANNNIRAAKKIFRSIDNFYTDEALEKLREINKLIKETKTKAFMYDKTYKLPNVGLFIAVLEKYLSNDDYYIDNGYVITDNSMNKQLTKLSDKYKGNYNFYANIDNFLTIDAKGRNWNQIKYDRGLKEYTYRELVKMLKDTGYYDNVSYNYDTNTFNLDNQNKDKEFVLRVLKLDDMHKPNLETVKTRDIAKDAQDKGYSGVIIKNVIDNGGRGSLEYASPANVYIFFNPTEQVKSADPITYDDNGNVVPLEERFNPKNNDLRFSLAPTEDNEGRELSEGQQEYFKDSKIRDNEGKLLTVYHGTPNKFTVFDISNGRPDMDIQAAFFTPVREEAEGYAGYNNGNVGEFYLNITNPADYDTAYAIFDKYKGKNSDAGIKAREELEKLGYDGVFVEDEDYPEYLAFKPEQIKNIDNLNPTENEDIRHSLSQQDANDKIENFKQVHEDIGRQLKLVQGAKLDTRQIKSIAQKLKKELGSKIDTVELGMQLNKLFTMIENKKGNINNTDVMDKAHQIVRDVMEQAREVEPEVKQFLNDMRTRKIYVSDKDKAEIGDYNFFRKNAFGKLRLVNSKEGAMPIDEFFEDLETYHPEVYDSVVGRDGNADAGRLVDLVDWIDAARQGGFSMYDMEGDSAVEHYALELLNTYANAKVEDITNNKAKQRELYKNIGEMVDFAQEQQKEIRQNKFNAQKEINSLMADINAKQKDISLKLEEQKQSLQDSYNKTLREEISKVKGKYSDRQAKAIAKLKAEQKQRNRKVKEQRERTERRQQTRRIRDRVKTTIKKPTVHKYIPKELIKPVTDLFNSIDLGEQFTMHRLNTMRDNAFIRYQGEELDNKLKELDKRELKFVTELKAFKDKLEDYAKNAEDDSSTYFKPVINLIEGTIDRVGQKSLMVMDAEELKLVNNTLRAIEKATTERNRPQSAKFVDEKGKPLETFEEIARTGLKQTKEADLGKISKAITSHMTGPNLLNAMGGFNPNSIFAQLADKFDQAYIDESQIKMDLNNKIAPVLSEKKGKTNFTHKSEVARRYGKDDLVDVGFKDQEGKPILLNHDSLIYEYLNLESDDNLTHAARGGITFPDYKNLYNRKGSKAVYGNGVRTGNIDKEITAIERQMQDAYDSEDYNLLRSLAANKSNIMEARKKELRQIRRNISKELTDYDRDVIKAWRTILVESTKRLNEYWAKTYGYEPFTVAIYWRIITDPNFIKGNDGGNIVQAITNLSESGSTIARQEGAGNPILSGSALFAIDDYINNTAKLIAYSGLQRDLNAIMKYKLPGYKNVQKAIEQKMPKVSENFFTLQQDLFGGRPSEDGLGNRAISTLRGLSARAVLSPNLRVALAQVPSYLGTARYLDKKALINAFLPKNRVKQETINKYTPLMWARGASGFSLETSDIKADTNKLLRGLNKVNNLAGGWIYDIPTKMDAATVRREFGAALDYTRRNFPDLKEGTPEQIAKGESELYKKAAEIFNEMVARTQPMFNVFNRNAWQRSNNELAKTLTIFHTQTFQYLNLAIKDILTYKYEKKNGTAKSAAKAKNNAIKSIAAILASTVLFNLIKQLVDKGPRHKKDELDPLYITEQVGSSLANMFILGSTLTDGIYSLLTKGNIKDFELYGESTINDFIDLAEQTKKFIDGKEVDLKAEIETVLGGLGIPASNIDKDFGGLMRNVEDMLDNGQWDYSNEPDKSSDLSEEAQVGQDYALGKIDAKELNKYIDDIEVPEGADPEAYKKSEESKVKNKIKSTVEKEYNAGLIDNEEAFKTIKDSDMFHSTKSYQTDDEYIEGIIAKWQIDSYKDAWIDTYGDKNGAKERTLLMKEIKKLPYKLAFPENPNIKPTYKAYKSSEQKLLEYVKKWVK